MTPTFTIQEAVQYMIGWLDSRADTQALTLDDLETMFHNARFCVRDPNDGIEAQIARK